MEQFDYHIEVTADGSHTLYVPQLNERFHSGYGAVQESMHIFIRDGFRFGMKDKAGLQILEVGFGTGLNALLTCLDAEHFHIKTAYTSIEPYPLNEEIISRLNYPEVLKKKGSDNFFHDIHHAEWNVPVKISKYFTILKLNDHLENISLKKECNDLVYFDAFAPQVQPELWEINIFTDIYHSLVKGGALLTYSAKGTVKRNLAAAGFTVENLPGPPGKREITRALK